MKAPTFFRGLLIAAVLGIAASAFAAAFIPFLGAVTVARLVIPGLALAYLVFLLRQSGERTGRVTLFALWGAMAMGTWLFVPSFAFYVLIHTGALWLIRSLYFYSGVLPSLLDLALSGFAVVAALGTAHRTGSVFLATWAFFLVQALYVAIPATVRVRANMGKRADPAADRADDRFERSRRHAEAALRQLITP